MSAARWNKKFFSCNEKASAVLSGRAVIYCPTQSKRKKLPIGDCEISKQSLISFIWSGKVVNWFSYSYFVLLFAFVRRSNVSTQLDGKEFSNSTNVWWTKLCANWNQRWHVWPFLLLGALIERVSRSSVCLHYSASSLSVNFLISFLGKPPETSESNKTVIQIVKFRSTFKNT